MGRLYSGEVTMTDRWLGRFLDKMEELNLFENTLLIAIPDHGIAFGEHGIVGKMPSSLWPEVTDIVFFVRHPGGKGAGTSDYYASTPRRCPDYPRFPWRISSRSSTARISRRCWRTKSLRRGRTSRLSYHDHVFTRDERIRHDGP